MNDLVTFAASRIQARERLPEINPELAEGIRGLARTIIQTPAGDLQEPALAEFMGMLEGVPATLSLPVVAGLLNSAHADTVRKYLLATRASLSRIQYLDRLEALAELFTPLRVKRITETARYIEEGWGW